MWKALVPVSIVSIIVGALLHWAATRFVVEWGDATDSSPDLRFRQVKDAINPVTEITNDRNQDGKADEWDTFIRENDPWGADYDLRDTNYDGVPDVLCIGLARGKTVIKYYDRNYDGKFDCLEVINLSRTVPNLKYAYQDLDLDGRFDILARTGDSPGFWIRIKDRWENASRQGGDPWELARISTDGKATDVRFVNGEWSIATASAQ